MPFFKILLLSFFTIVLLYSLIRPFASWIARVFFVSVADSSYSIMISDFLGMREADLYLYMTLLTVFLFVGYTLNRFDQLNKKISILVKEIAIIEKTNIKH